LIIKQVLRQTFQFLGRNFVKSLELQFIFENLIPKNSIQCLKNLIERYYRPNQFWNKKIVAVVFI